LATFLKSSAAPKIPNGQKEKAAVVAKLPSLSEKIDLLGPQDWNAFRAAAKKVT
jgi:hypothetical protein